MVSAKDPREYIKFVMDKKRVPKKKEMMQKAREHMEREDQQQFNPRNNYGQRGERRNDYHQHQHENKNFTENKPYRE